MKKTIVIVISIIIALLLITAGIVGFNIYNKNKEIKQRQDAVSSLENQFDDYFASYDELEILNALEIIQTKYSDEFESFASSFKSKTEELVQIREKESADFLMRLNSQISISNNTKIQKLSTNLTRLIENNFENMLLSQLKGRWRRQDSSNLSGTVITVNVSGEIPAATITDVSSAVNNQNYFKVGDVKWNYITCVDKSVFTFTDMWKTGEFDINYHQARGVYNYETDTIDILVDVSDGNGITQHLVRDIQP